MLLFPKIARRKETVGAYCRVEKARSLNSLSSRALAFGRPEKKPDIQVNRGYMCACAKKAFFVNPTPMRSAEASLVAADSGDIVADRLEETVVLRSDGASPMRMIDFTKMRCPGRYYIQIGRFRSEEFVIADSPQADKMISPRYSFVRANGLYFQKMARHVA